MKNVPLVVEQTYNAPAAQVWKALTDKDQMKQWYFDIQDFKPELNHEFQFEAGSDTKKYLHACKITEVEPGKKLTYSWRYPEYEGNSFVTFELTPEGNKTKLTLTHRGLDTFPDDQPDFARANFEQGWKEILSTSLKDHLEKPKATSAS